MAAERIIRESVLAAMAPIGWYYPVIASRVIGTAISLAGLYGIFQPVSTAHLFGVMWADERSSVFVPAFAGRNLAAGLMIFGLNYMQDYKAVGVVLTCCMINGIADTYICLTRGEKAIDHIVNIFVLGVLGPRLIAVG